MKADRKEAPVRANNTAQKIWFSLLPLLAIAAFFLLSGILSYGVSSVFSNVLHVPADKFAEISYLAEALVGVILVILFFGVYKAAFRKDTPEVKTALSAREALMSVAAGIGVSGVSFLWTLIAEKIPALSSSLAAMDKVNSEMGGAVGVILLAVIIAPLLEELIFRGIVFRSLEKLKPGWVPVLISAVVFGAYHMNLVQAVYATGMGIVAAIIYAKTRNLMFPILVHMANNLIAAIQSFLPSEASITAVNIFTVIMILPMCYVVCRMLIHKDGKRSRLGLLTPSFVNVVFMDALRPPVCRRYVFAESRVRDGERSGASGLLCKQTREKLIFESLACLLICIAIDFF